MTTSACSPLHKSLFCDRSIASIVSNIGCWLEDTEGAWLISSITISPLFPQLYNPVLFLPNISRTDIMSG
ncbi:MFS transporter [Nostoc sp. 'Peltigera membranacea cyanobiont' 210A]|uniref:MFS transporter n=1 Tax=Nostoc sp. 'Peltigera membranacea cyanobiont' 210A TaxID=2014529 RepID=UPI00117FAF4D|nr:MFS transporter [Nostoc sp. 'Peltigera membranacea cyanobiont' 210A]